MNNYDSLILGVDGGGSKCRVILFDQEKGILATGVSGPANVMRSAEKTIEHIVDATDKALAVLDLPPSHKSKLVAGLGLAGLNLPSCQQAMNEWQHPFKQAFFTSDLHIACVGAHKGDDGAVMIVGTGSSALAVENQQITELGGHGFPVGDGGSGAWLGFKTIEYTLQSLDKVVEPSELTKAVIAQYQVANATDLAQLVSRFIPADFAKLAPLVIEHAKQQDPVAISLVKQGADYLSKLAKQLLADKSCSLALIGGLSPLIQVYFDNQIQQRIVPAQLPPEMGAVLYAQQQASN